MLFQYLRRLLGLDRAPSRAQLVAEYEAAKSLVNAARPALLPAEQARLDRAIAQGDAIVNGSGSAASLESLVTLTATLVGVARSR